MGCKDKNKYWLVQIIMLFLGAISCIFIAAEISYFYYARKLAKYSVSFHKNKRVCHKSMAHPFRFFSFFQIRN